MDLHKILIKSAILKLMRWIEPTCHYYLGRDNEFHPFINPLVGIRAPQPCDMDTQEIWEYGLDKIQVALTQLISREIRQWNVEGDIAEVGVFRGFNASVINYFFSDRQLYLFDTFDGLDQRDLSEDKSLGYDTTKYRRDFANTSVDLVMSKMFHKQNIIIRKGWFPKSADGLEEKIFCFVFLDANLYRPMLEGLQWFYPRLAHGGYIVADLFNWNVYPGAKKAVYDFCKEVGASYIPIPNRTGSVVIGKPLLTRSK